MIIGQQQPTLSWLQIAEHQRRALLRKGGIMNVVARPAFLLIWGLVCYSTFHHAGPSWLWLPALCNLYFALGLYRRYRLIVDTATSRISSSAQGYVELEGRAWLPNGETFRGLAHLPVTVWVAGFSENLPFYLTDDRGCCLLYPDQAEIITRPANTHLYWLHAIYPGQTLYALGDMRTLGGDNKQLSHRQRVSELLSEWKSRPANLIEQFDRNDNGRLDNDEWDQVVQAAHRLAHEDLQEARSQPGTHVIDQSTAGRLFLITNIPPLDLAWQYRVAALLHTVSWLALLIIFNL